MADSAVQPTQGQLVYEARLAAGYTSLRSFAKDVAEELHIPWDSARIELTAIEKGRRGMSDRYVRAVSDVTGVPMLRFRQAGEPLTVEAAFQRLLEAVHELSGKLDLLLEQRQDGDRAD